MADEERRRKRDKLISSYKFTETRAIIVPTNNFPMAKNKASVGRTRIKQKQEKKRGKGGGGSASPFYFRSNSPGRTIFARWPRRNPSFESARTHRNGVIARIRFVESRGRIVAREAFALVPFRIYGQTTLPAKLGKSSIADGIIGQTLEPLRTRTSAV